MHGIVCESRKEYLSLSPLGQREGRAKERRKLSFLLRSTLFGGHWTLRRHRREPRSVNRLTLFRLDSVRLVGFVQVLKPYIQAQQSHSHRTQPSSSVTNETRLAPLLRLHFCLFCFRLGASSAATSAMRPATFARTGSQYADWASTGCG